MATKALVAEGPWEKEFESTLAVQFYNLLRNHRPTLPPIGAIITYWSTDVEAAPDHISLWYHGTNKGRDAGKALLLLPNHWFIIIIWRHPRTDSLQDPGLLAVSMLNASTEVEHMIPTELRKKLVTIENPPEYMFAQSPLVVS